MITSVGTYAELADGYFPENINHIFLHVPDATAETSDADGLKFLIKMRDYLNTHPDQKILIHCQYRKSRSVMLCAALLLSCPQETGYEEKPFKNLREVFQYIKSKQIQSTPKSGIDYKTLH